MHHVIDIHAAISPETEVAAIQQLGAVIVSLLGIIGIVLGAMVNRTRQHAKATRTDAALAASDAAIVKGEVKNDHEANFRDEADDRHDQLLNEIRAVRNTVTGQGRAIVEVKKSLGGIRDEIRGMRDDDRQVRAELDEERKRIRNLEDTRPGKAPS